MKTNSTSGPDKVFWAIGAFAVIWNALGGINFYMQLTLSDLSFMPEWWRAVAESRPDWATGAMAVGVFGGMMGGVFLLLKRRFALYVFVFSLIGTILTMSHAFGVAGAGFRQIFEGLIMPVVMSVFFIFYSKICIKKGWIN